MEQKHFKNMWEHMQSEGYFENHPHYSDHFGKLPDADERQLDLEMMSLDFSADDVTMPIPYSDKLERSVKRTEAYWLYKMFDLPGDGVALDLGCGFGRSVKWMSERYSQVFASDISATVIDEARRRLGDTDNVTFCVNPADTLPAELMLESIDVAYIFTVFQHIPREYSSSLLDQIGQVLKPRGVVVFNLLSEFNEELNVGNPNTEWAIGYSKNQAKLLVEGAGLQVGRLVRWSRPESEISWLWVLAQKPAA